MLVVPATRAVVRPIEAGAEDVFCPAERGGCGQEVKFVAQVPSRFRLRVIANVYFAGAWNRTEQWHVICYVAAGMPYGRPANLSDDHLALIRDALESASGRAVLETMVALAHERQFRLNISVPRRS